MTTTDAAPTEVPPITHAEARGLAEEAYRRLADLAEGFDADDWSKPTDCEGWAVADVIRHLVGAMRAAASMRENVSQQIAILRRTRATGDPMVDVMTALQIERTAGRSTDQLVTELRSLVAPAATGRHRTPAPLRRLVRARVQMGSIDERWSLGYLVDVILTRDAWLHRVDLCRATARQPALTPDHDGRIVADVAAEWARRHGQPVHLALTGPAGGTFRFGDPTAEDVTRLEPDAIDFCRTVSGRATGTGLLTQEVPF